MPRPNYQRSSGQPRWEAPLKDLLREDAGRAPGLEVLDAARALLEKPTPPGRLDALEDALQERQEELRGRHGLRGRGIRILRK